MSGLVHFLLDAGKTYRRLFCLSKIYSFFIVLLSQIIVLFNAIARFIVLA